MPKLYVRNRMRVSARIAASLTDGFFTVCVVDDKRHIVHLTPRESFASPLCGATTDTYEQNFWPDDKDLGHVLYTICGKCLVAAGKTPPQAKGKA